MRRDKDELTLQDVEKAIAGWEEAVRWIAKGWDCIEEYTNNLSYRESLDEAVLEYIKKHPLPDELNTRIQEADRKFKEITEESDRCVWSNSPEFNDKERYWYYYRWQFNVLKEEAWEVVSCLALEDLKAFVESRKMK